VEQEYEMKPMLGVPSSKLLETESSIYDSKVGNGDLKKYSSASIDNMTNEKRRFINVTNVSDTTSVDEAEFAKKPCGEGNSEDDGLGGDFSEEAPHHKLHVRKSSCYDCKTNAPRCRCADLEVRIQEMSGNMQRLESQMGILISLLEGNGIPSTFQNRGTLWNQTLREVSDPNRTVTSV